jgi:hypothetical protein
MDLEAAQDATQATRPFASSRESVYLLLQPYDPGKIAVVLIHGLLSTPHVGTVL